MRAALYLRRSTQDMQPDSLKAQEEILRRYAADNGLEIVRVYEDSASGTSLKDRTGFGELIDKVLASADFELLLVRDVSRFGRFFDPDEAAYWEFFFLSHGVKTIYTEETFGADLTPLSSLTKSIKRVMASEYSREKSRMIRRAQARTARQGFLPNGAAPYGMRRVMVNSKGEIVAELEPGQWKSLATYRTKLAPGSENEVHIVREVFRWFAEGELGFQPIARKLNANRVPPPEGEQWYAATVRYILENTVYAGASHYRLRESRWRDPINIPDIEQPEAYERIIDEEMWAKAQARMSRLVHRRTREELAAEFRLAFERHGIVEAKALEKVPGSAARATYNTRFARGYVEALELAYREEIAAARDSLRAALGNQFKIDTERDGWLVNDLLRVDFRAAFPKKHLGRVHWEFRFPDELPPLTIGLAFSVPPVDHTHTFAFRASQVRPGRSVLPNVEGGQVRRRFLIKSVDHLAKMVKRCLYVRNPEAERRLIEVMSSKTLLNFAEVGRETGIPVWAIGTMVRSLEERGHYVPPRQYLAGRRIDVVCERCGKKRTLSPSDALAQQGRHCRDCGFDGGRI